jgi:nitrile hydratase
MSARFAPGDRVRIADRWPAGHHRVPGYVKGRAGTVLSAHGDFGRPEVFATYGDGRPKAALYRVRLAQTALWADYAGPPADALEIEIHEHWLEPL